MMSWLGIGKEISEPVNAISEGLDSLFTSDEEREKAKFVLEKLRQKPLIMQAMINQEHAKSGSIFHAGWRSFAGWVCVGGLMYSSILGPLMLQIFGWDYVEINIGILIDLLVAMLGLAGLRTYEKSRGTAKP